MVHYVFTPWRDRRELLAVRRQFYPDGTAHSGLAGGGAGCAPDAAAAVARVAVWMQRGHCPHMVESTALLAAALLEEDKALYGASAATSAAASAAAYAARAAYAAAFSRFVTGLLDGHQDRARKLSMHGLARTVGLPPAFVELRHQATHEPLPALRRLRAGARQALAWIWQYYWEHLGEEDDDTRVEEEGEDDACRATVTACVDDSADDTLAPLVRRWGDARVLAALAALAGDGDAARTLRCMRLSRQVLQQQKEAAAAEATTPRRRTRAETKTTAQTDGDGPADDSSPARPWTAATLDLDAVRARVAQQRQALYQMESRQDNKAEEEEEEQEEKDKDDKDDNDVAMAGTDPDADADDEWPPPRPCWTRFEGDWTPRPIGALVRA